MQLCPALTKLLKDGYAKIMMMQAKKVQVVFELTAAYVPEEGTIKSKQCQPNIFFFFLLVETIDIYIYKRQGCVSDQGPGVCYTMIAETFMVCLYTEQ